MAGVPGEAWRRGPGAKVPPIFAHHLVTPPDSEFGIRHLAFGFHPRSPPFPNHRPGPGGTKLNCRPLSHRPSILHHPPTSPPARRMPCERQQYCSGGRARHSNHHEAAKPPVVESISDNDAAIVRNRPRLVQRPSGEIEPELSQIRIQRHHSKTWRPVEAARALIDKVASNDHVAHGVYIARHRPRCALEQPQVLHSSGCGPSRRPDGLRLVP